MKSLINKVRQTQELTQKCKDLNKKINRMYDNNPSIVSYRTQDFTVDQRDIPFNIQVLQKQQKDVGPSGSSSIENNLNKSAPYRKSDIFLEPFEQGICIDDSLTKTHRLLFNKYPSRRNHVLIVTKEREEQGEKLNVRDFEAAITVMKTLNGFFFYNSHPQSGASQSHKHMQVVPISSLPKKKIPINEKVMETIKRS